MAGIETWSELLPLARQAASAACTEILKVYQLENFGQQTKSDHSPVTFADQLAHEAIIRTLAPTGLPILSEEGKDVPYEDRKTWPSFWLVDPLDGTKEFIKRNGEFAVHIALIHRSEPVLGVVAIPVTGETFFAFRKGGAFVSKGDLTKKLPHRSRPQLDKENLRVVASRSHMSAETEAFLGDLVNPTIITKGSSLKFMLIATGTADVYPRFGPTMEWDTAAPHAIINEIGLEVLAADSRKPLTYNKESLVNPSFIVL